MNDISVIVKNLKKSGLIVTLLLRDNAWRIHNPHTHKTMYLPAVPDRGWEKHLRQGLRRIGTYPPGNARRGRRLVAHGG